MKQIPPMVIIALVILMAACSPTMYPEETLVKTKIYVGKYITTLPFGDTDLKTIQTTEALIILKECDNIPDNAWCYIQRELPRYDMHPDLSWQMEKQYLTWNGTTNRYRIKYNLKFNN